MSEALARDVPTSANRRAPEPVVAENAGFTGLLQLRGAARIDGEIEGEVIATGMVWIGETGRVRARVEAPEVVIAGELEGEVWASAKIELLATARVTAALYTPRLVLAEGSFFEGRCHTGSEGGAAGSEVLPRDFGPRNALNFRSSM
jgi:cytoskeletal protein CcmA (bactofilin family)